MNSHPQLLKACGYISLLLYLSSLGGTASRRQGRVESAGSGLRAGLQKEWGKNVCALV